MSEERIAGPQDGTPAENDTPQRMPSEEYQHGLTHTGARDGFSPEEDCPGSDQTKTASGKIEIEPEIPPGNTSQDVIPQETILQPGTSQAKEIPDSGAQQDHPPMPKSTKDRPSDEIHSAAEPLETEDISGRVSTSTAALTHDSGQQDPPPALKSTKDRTSDEMHSAAEPLETEDIPGRVSTSTAASIHDSGLQDHPPALKSTRDSPSDEKHSAAEPLETEDIPSRVSTSTAALTHDSDTPQSNAGSSPTPPALDARPGTELKELRSRVYSMLAAHHETQAVELLLCEVETRRKRMYDMKNLILKKMKIEEVRLPLLPASES